MSTENDPRCEHIYAHPYFLRGVGHEQKRIIELLEKQSLIGKYSFSHAISLIKGEHK